MYVTDYTLSDNQKELKQHNELKEDEHPALTKFATLFLETFTPFWLRK
jgi:decaprenylphospho-beta-D-ribofuranose 2-oxidase